MFPVIKNDSVIRPLNIGNRCFKTNLVQGPLAGFSAAPFRKLLWKYGGLAYACTEMISAKTLLTQQKQKAYKRYTYIDQDEGPVCFQLSGNDPKELATACQVSQDLGANLVDLNCGCPQPKIIKKHCGAQHLEQLPLLTSILSAMRKNLHCPLTVKVRLYSKPSQQQNIALAKLIEEHGADALIVHGRTTNERYDTACDVEAIAAIVASVNIPVLINGDVADYQSLRQSLEKSGAAGAMIARASIGKPWIFNMLNEKNIGRVPHEPPVNEIKNCLVEHILGLCSLQGDLVGLLQSRKIIPYYLKGLSGLDLDRLTDEVNRTETIDALLVSLEQPFARAARAI